MAIKKTTGAKKPTAKKIVTKAVAKPQAKVTKSRGSNTTKQVGDQNQLEGGRIKDTYGYNPKVSAQDISDYLKQAAKDKQLGTDMGLSSAIQDRQNQRAGGSLNLSQEEGARRRYKNPYETSTKRKSAAKATKTTKTIKAKKK